MSPDSTDVRLFLAIDNCFASKRWCEVPEWMRVVRDLGLRCVEASADNEIDPLYSCREFLDDWIRDVRRESDAMGVCVVNCYSGHGTYSTLGLAHHDARVRRHIQAHWVEPMLRTAGALHAGLGMFAHAFSEKVLRDKRLYDQAFSGLIDALHEVSVAAERAGVPTFGIEQMYTPHQVPWTVTGTAEFLRRANAKTGGLPVYITLDTGHQTGQDRFRPPTLEQLDVLRSDLRSGRSTEVYLGPRECFEAIRERVLAGATLAQLQREVDALVAGHPYLFSQPGDGDPYLWLEHYAAYSPIIHLQQTDGTCSGHACFTRRTNATGIISAPKVLRAMCAGWKQPVPPGFPPPVREIYLTLEPFIGTADHPRLALEEIDESVRYWRQYVPQDGMTMEAVMSRLGIESDR
jgi:sugar phosphate isomerase/epimerase